jgi:hypothetical protein
VKVIAGSGSRWHGSRSAGRRSRSRFGLAHFPRKRGGSDACWYASVQAIRDDEIADDRAIVDGIAIPLASVRVCRYRERLVRGANAGPAEIRRHRALRHCDDRPPMRIAKLRPLIRIQLDRVSVLVHITMVTGTHQAAISQAGFTAIGPVLDVMPFQKERRIRLHRAPMRC